MPISFKSSLLALSLSLLLTPAWSNATRLEQAEQRLQAGQAAQAQALVEQAVQDQGLQTESAWLLLRAQVAQGQIDAAFATITKLTQRQQWLPAEWLEGEPALAAMRNDARWPAVLAQAQARDSQQQRLYGAAALETPYRETLPLNERLAGVSRLWSEAKYNFANFDLVPQLDWDAVYLRTLERVKHTPRTLDYYRELQRMIAQLQDGHSNVYPAEALFDRMWARPALRTARIEGRVLITEVLDPQLSRQGLAPGQEILRIDRQAVDAHVRARVLPFLAASTPQDREARAYGAELLAGDVRQKVALQLRVRDGAAEAVVKTVTIPRLGVEQVFPLMQREPFAWRMLPGQVALVTLNGFDDDTAADAYLQAFDAIAQARAIVFDLRHNGGGNSGVGYRILATLTSQPLPTSKWWTRGHVSAWRAWGRPMPVEGGSHGEIQPDAQRHFSGPVAVLTSAGTYSAAEDFVAAFKALRRGPVVGTATGGSTGQPLFFKLPGGGQARICAKRDLLADGTEFVGKGIAVDVPVAASVAAWRAGRDEVLEAALTQLGERAR
ncbi:S41 family peptidase [Roseateles sp.]|uniref:S41 family peptidase n=1 Tax=Roseateles sp. TaxID=1971397 RepID=UPI003BA3F457